MPKFIIVNTIVLMCALAGVGRADAPRPNILLVLTDDIGWGDPLCYNADSKIPTPNIDKLAAEGMRFTNAHTPAALCSPTRYSMLSGNHPCRSRSTSGVWGINVPSAFKPGQQSVASMLRKSGYRTAMFGKAGIGGYYARAELGKTKEKLAPIQWGFDYSWIIPKGHQKAPLAFFENGIASSKLVANRAPDWSHAAVGASLLHKANAFLDDYAANHKDQPFYMHFCTDGAHGPYAPAETLAGRRLKGATKMTPHTDMILETDILLGALIDALEKRGLRDDTLVIYTSDNGGLPYEREHGHDSVAGLRGLKATIFEGGTRVPFVASWPGKIPAGTIRHQLIGAHDTVATALELAGVAIPGDQAIDSVSLAPVLLGKRDDSHPVRQDLMTQSSPGRGPNVDKGYRAGKPGPEKEIKGGKSGGLAFAYYREDWKLVITSSGKPASLYNLTNDLAEENNLVENVNQAKRVAMMLEAYRKIRSRKQR